MKFGPIFFKLDFVKFLSAQTKIYHLFQTPDGIFLLVFFQFFCVCTPVVHMLLLYHKIKPVSIAGWLLLTPYTPPVFAYGLRLGRLLCLAPCLPAGRLKGARCRERDYFPIRYNCIISAGEMARLYTRTSSSLPGK